MFRNPTRPSRGISRAFSKYRDCTRVVMTASLWRSRAASSDSAGGCRTKTPSTSSPATSKFSRLNPNTPCVGFLNVSKTWDPRPSAPTSMCTRPATARIAAALSSENADGPAERCTRTLGVSWATASRTSSMSRMRTLRGCPSSLGESSVSGQTFSARGSMDSWMTGGSAAKTVDWIVTTCCRRALRSVSGRSGRLTSCQTKGAVGFARTMRRSKTSMKKGREGSLRRRRSEVAIANESPTGPAPTTAIRKQDPSSSGRIMRVVY
mmetsp:Transcript_25973/g.64907  ORF Transcript_25973/g.64907 Transcript_25973/m.64907 type:complete len:265 (+) Transcript_25973:1828-2622(+)